MRKGWNRIQRRKDGGCGSGVHFDVRFRNGDAGKEVSLLDIREGLGGIAYFTADQAGLAYVVEPATTAERDVNSMGLSEFEDRLMGSVPDCGDAGFAEVYLKVCISHQDCRRLNPISTQSFRRLQR